MQAYFEKTLLPLLRGDGGEAEFIGFDGQTLSLRFRGECSKCSVLPRCAAWCEAKILRDTGKTVRIAFTRQKPYFWDT